MLCIAILSLSLSLCVGSLSSLYSPDLIKRVRLFFSSADLEETDCILMKTFHSQQSFYSFGKAHHMNLLELNGAFEPTYRGVGFRELIDGEEYECSGPGGSLDNWNVRWQREFEVDDPNFK